MEAVEIIKLISEVGFLAVCAGIFLWLAFRMFNKQQSWLETMIKDLQASRHPSPKEVANLDIVNNKIYQELRGVLNAIKADRVYVVLYHNGGKSSSGLFFQKMSCVCEVVSSGILPMSNQYKELHRASYSMFLDKLAEDKEILLPDTSYVKNIDNFLYQQLVTRHALASYFRLLKDSDGYPTGFIGVDYCALNETITDSEISKILKVVGLKVSALVDIRDEVSK